MMCIQLASRGPMTPRATWVVATLALMVVACGGKKQSKAERGSPPKLTPEQMCKKGLAWDKQKVTVSKLGVCIEIFKARKARNPKRYDCVQGCYGEASSMSELDRCSGKCTLRHPSLEKKADPKVLAHARRRRSACFKGCGSREKSKQLDCFEACVQQYDRTLKKR